MTQAPPPIDVQPYHWLIVRDVLRKQVPQYAVWAFGSRATWKAKTYSDLDLAIITDKPLSLTASAELNEAFSESDLPWKVDVVDWSTINDDFRNIITRDKIVIQEPKQNRSETIVLPLEDCMEALIDYRGKTPKKVESGIPLITAKVIKNGRIYPPDEFIAEEDFSSWMIRGHPEVGDIVLTTEAPLGEVGQIKSLPIALAQRIITLRGKPSILDNTYLLYLLQSDEMQTKLLGRSTGTTVVGIKQSELRKIELVLPPIAEQRAIAHILGTLDDKIELNRRRNQTLEAMARALFQDWFVDFGPVRARMAGRARHDGARSGQPRTPQASDLPWPGAEAGAGAQGEPYLPAHLWQLFPDRLDDEGKPEGWEMGTLADFASLNPESWSKRNVPEVIEYVDLANTKLGTIESAARLPWSEAPSRAQRILRTGDTIVGTVRPGNGSYALVGADGLTGSTGFAVLRPKQPTYREFVFLAATSAENVERLSHLADGAAYPAVRPDVVSASAVAKPDQESLDGLMKAFSTVAGEWIDSMEHNKVESKALAQLRDTLLPKLISGELRIKDAERIAEQMA